MFKIGDKIIVVTDLTDPTTLREYTVSKVGKDTLQCNNSSECTFYTAFCWPIAAKENLVDILEYRRKLKTRLDDSMSLVYELRNQLSKK